MDQNSTDSKETVLCQFNTRELTSIRASLNALGLPDRIESDGYADPSSQNDIVSENDDEISVKVVNGNSLSHRHIYVPPELLQKILSYCDDASLLKISEVCQSWHEIFLTEYFWYYVMKNRGLENEWPSICSHLRNHPDSWQVYFSMAKSQFLNRNLVRNPSGAEGLGNWAFMSGESGGWTVETELDFDLIKMLPDDSSDKSKCCFATNQFSCSKEQNIDLWKSGFTPPVMRAIVPFMITWSELVSTPVGHSGVYEAKVLLLDTDLGHISPYTPYEHRIRANLDAGTHWKLYKKDFRITWKNAHEIIDDLRYFYIYHGGMENESTEGHFGPKMARTSVKISLIT